MNVELNNFFSAFLNAEKRKKTFIYLKFSNRIFYILKVFKKEGFLSHFLIEKGYLKIYLKNFPEVRKKSEFIKIFIQKNFRKAFSYKEFSKLIFKSGSLILDTNKGVLSDSKAKKLKLGGFILFYLK